MGMGSEWVWDQNGYGVRMGLSPEGDKKECRVGGSNSRIKKEVTEKDPP